MHWKKQVHPLYKDWPNDLTFSCPIGKWQWIAKGFSIICPSEATFGDYELYDGEDIYRFATLKEAKEKAKLIDNMFSIFVKRKK